METRWAVCPAPRQTPPGQSARPRAPRPLGCRVGQAAWASEVSGEHRGKSRTEHERAAVPVDKQMEERHVPGGEVWAWKMRQGERGAGRKGGGALPGESVAGQMRSEEEEEAGEGEERSSHEAEQSEKNSAPGTPLLPVGPWPARPPPHEPYQSPP